MAGTPDHDCGASVIRLDPDRVSRIEALRLAKGAHDSFASGAGVMEAVAYVAGEPFSDHPQCASPVLGAFLRAWNDRLDDETRQRLKPYVVRLVGTAGSDKAERLRRDMLWEWVLGTLVPTWLETAGMQAEANDVRARGRPALGHVREEAWERRMAARERLIALVRAYAASASAHAAPADAAYEAAAYAAAAYAASAACAASAAYAASASDASDAADASLADAAASYDAAAAATSAYVDADTDAYAAYATYADNAADAAYFYVEAVLAPTALELQDSAFDLLDRLIDVHREAA
jgi:hypothetical protein